MAMEGLCLVISPLIALMKDQVEALRKKNITAYSIYSGMSRKDVINILEVATRSNCKFLYVSPERLETGLFREYLPGLPINLLAVDEAHCISQWGYDFRPPYLRIAALRKELNNVPVLALTASATPEVQQDICDKLSIPKKEVGPVTPSNWKIFRQSFERPNLSYSVFNVDPPFNKIIDILRKVEGTGIIYCRSRKRTKEISDLLQLHHVSSAFYHAGLSQEDRNRKQEEWINDKTRVMVCTNAFGMGIDKPGVRVVIHADSPDCLENYYQEAGRAGRDGKKAYAVLLFQEKQLQELLEMPEKRFPPLETIKEIYQAVCNYLQLHPGDGAGNYYDFDLGDFVKKFKLESQSTLYSLKALEQDGWLAFNEQVFLPSFAGFNVEKNYLYRFEQENPSYAELLKSMLRTYEGIFDQPVAISEKMLAGILKQDAENIKTSLQYLDKAGIIEYRPQKDTPQLLFLRPRIKVEQLSIDLKAYEKRKQLFKERVNKMADFINGTACRSRMIAEYFGDDKVPDCGICDNCLQRKSRELDSGEFREIQQKILEILGKDKSFTTRDLQDQLKNIKKENFWKVIEFLQAEKKIEVNAEGKVTTRT